MKHESVLKYIYIYILCVLLEFYCLRWNKFHGRLRRARSDSDSHTYTALESALHTQHTRERECWKSAVFDGYVRRIDTATLQTRYVHRTLYESSVWVYVSCQASH